MTVVDIGVHRSLAHWRAHPIEFIETVLFDPETGRPFKLLRPSALFSSTLSRSVPMASWSFPNGFIRARRSPAKRP
jgi:hypothetical protein